MWPLQEIAGDDKGSWPWLEFGHEEPWEADDSRFYGATLAAMRIRTGNMHINSARLDFGSCFGGYKESGNAREWGEAD